ncbi:MAG: hypothetical protein JKY20_04710 [Alphaproteobacteria bacterium]|nr:hypothetical protein [Alphaproteobacteria bacterium]
MIDKAYDAAAELKVSLHSLQSEDLTDAMMQLAIVHSKIDCIRSLAVVEGF